MLLDTCIVIDVLRGKTAAAAFLTGLPRPPAICAERLRSLSPDAETPEDGAKLTDCCRILSFATLASPSQASPASTSGVTERVMVRIP